MSLVLSLFPGIGLLDMAFEQEGYCIVRGPDLLWGGDIHSFNPPPKTFQGIIGGPPCQAHVLYANLNRTIGNTVAPDLTPEFVRVVERCQPEWFLMENSILMPTIKVAGYSVQAILLNAVLFGLEQNRKRKFQFGSQLGHRIRVDVLPIIPGVEEKACLASEGAAGVISNKRQNGKQKSYYTPRRPWSRFCELQGLPPDFLQDAPFTLKGRYKLVGNGVPLPMGRAVAKGVTEAVYARSDNAARMM